MVSHPMLSLTRRAWLTHNAVLLGTAVPRRAIPRHTPVFQDAAQADRVAAHAVRLDPTPLQTLVQRAVEAARASGARYADARLTRSVGHVYQWQTGTYLFTAETEVQGIGVRALVDGYWGFSASCVWNADEVVRLAQDAVAQARTNARVSNAGARANTAGAGSSAGAANASRTVELAPTPVVTGTWATPIAIDPFTVPVEEKLDHIVSWDTLARQHGLVFPFPLRSSLTFVRRENVLATSEGSAVTQTVYETGGDVVVQASQDESALNGIQGLETMGRGWELVLEAKIPEQLTATPARFMERFSHGARPASVGRYTIVCDGGTMAAMLANTLGTATQLDRALGYEANATGTSVITDPLAMLGTLVMASPLVTVTANRSAPTQLATVKWDDEGVAPEPWTLIEKGVLTDFQTTREHATWLAPFYAKHGRPIRSHGCAAAEDALVTQLQMLPNLALEPSGSAATLDALVASVPKGILVTNGTVMTDFQAQTGLLFSPAMREIKNGRLGGVIVGGAIQFNSMEFWKNITAIGGSSTNAVIGQGSEAFIYGGHGAAKGEPPQSTSYSAQGVAAIIPNQALINPGKKA